MDYKIGVIFQSLYYPPLHFLEFLEPFIAIGDSLSAEQHLARLNRKIAIGDSLSA